MIPLDYACNPDLIFGIQRVYGRVNGLEVSLIIHEPRYVSVRISDVKMIVKPVS